MPNNSANNTIPTKPNIIDGIPVSDSAANSIIFTNFLLVAYSVRYIAAPVPNGKTIAIATIIMYMVFSRFGKIPITCFT